jgi:serine protease Do/serine protease DegQ
MKNADSSSLLRKVVALAMLAIFSGSVGAQTSASPTTSLDKASLTQVATAPGPIHYTYDETPLDRSNHAILSSYADMLNKVTPGVVGVYPSRRVQQNRASSARPYRGRGGYTQQPIAPDMLWASEDSTAYRIIGVGSGCILSPDGYIITNHHVVEENNRAADAFLVKLSDGREFEGRLIGSDPLTDLALLKIDAKDLPTVKMADSEKTKVGDIVFAVGNPMDVGFTVTHGIVSATGRSKLDLISDPRNPRSAGAGFEDFIQTDAAINPGNSGGPLVDAQGRLVGLNAAIVSNSEEGGSIGLGFAIPSSLVRKVADDLIKDGRVRRGTIGVDSDDITHTLAQALKLPSTHGAIITSIDSPGTPAAQVGLTPGDVITKVDNDEVDSHDKLRYLIAMHEPGTAVNLTVVRRGETKAVKVMVADLDELNGVVQPGASVPRTRPAAPAPAAPRNPDEILGGVSLMPFTADMRQTLGLPANITSGVVVIDIARNSPFYNKFGPGSVILEANEKPVATLAELRAALKPGDINVFYVYRTDLAGGNGKLSYVTQNIPGNP